MKAPTITNSPTLKCEVCGNDLEHYEKWANNDQGLIFCVHIDSWPEYFLDKDGFRHELCGPACAIKLRDSLK